MTTCILLSESSCVPLRVVDLEALTGSVRSSTAGVALSDLRAELGLESAERVLPFEAADGGGIPAVVERIPRGWAVRRDAMGGGVSGGWSLLVPGQTRFTTRRVRSCDGVGSIPSFGDPSSAQAFAHASHGQTQKVFPQASGSPQEGSLGCVFYSVLTT